MVRTLPGAAGPAPRPAPISVTRTRAPRHGADSTSEDAAPAPVWFSATTPCSCRAGTAELNTPGVPFGPPGVSMAAVTGTVEEICNAPKRPDSDDRATEATEPPGMSRPQPPVGW